MRIGLSLLTCPTAWLPVQSLKSEDHPLDLVPFAVPSTPANEVRFEDPREIREVIVTLKSAPPANLGFSYLHKTWRAGAYSPAIIAKILNQQLLELVDKNGVNYPMLQHCNAFIRRASNEDVHIMVQRDRYAGSRGDSP